MLHKPWNFVTCLPYHRRTQKAPSVQQVGSDAGGIMHAVGCRMLLRGDSTFIGTLFDCAVPSVTVLVLPSQTEAAYMYAYVTTYKVVMQCVLTQLRQNTCCVSMSSELQIVHDLT